MENAVQGLLETRQQGPALGFLQAPKSAVPKYSEADDLSRSLPQAAKPNPVFSRGI